MKKLVTYMLLISASVLCTLARGEVYIDFKTNGGDSSPEERIILSDLGNNPVSYTNTHKSFGGAGLSDSNQVAFSVATATGQIAIIGHAYSDDGSETNGMDDFNPDTWTGGNLTGTFDGTTGIFNSGSGGPGVKDATGFNVIEEGEAILLQFDLSGLSLPPGTTVLLTGIEIFVGVPDHSDGWWLYQRDTSIATGASGAGVLVGSKNYPPPDIVITNGATFAIMGEFRLSSLTLDIAEPPPYEQWAKGWNADIGVGMNDYDGDGVFNFYEYGMGGNPTDALDQGTLPELTKSGTNLFYTHPMRSDDGTIAYTVKTTTNLVGGIWNTTGYTIDGTNTDASLYIVTNKINTAENNQFIRLVIE